jgi:NAD(P)-dependent dehydrogenase (short-subunit alcohol dehydrogenase family)
MSGKLYGKIAVITGGNSGIGLATAKRFVDEGAYVFITGRRQAELDAGVKEIGKNVTAVQCDVTKRGDLDRLYATVKEEKGRIDILFANAGIGEFASLREITEEHFDRIFGTNVKGVLFFTVQKALPFMLAGSSVILNASISGSKGQPNFSVYCATKAALRSFARTWTTDLKDRGIRVNAVSPGYIDTPGLNGLLASSGTERRQSTSAETVPLGRFGTPDDIAKAVVFLASHDSSYMAGTDIFVDGGYAQV